MSRIILGDWEDGGKARLDVARLIATRGLIQASSGGGKSWALRRLLEITSGHVQQIIIDPEGEFPSLRERHDLVICAAQGGDALAHPKTARLLALRLLETQVSAVINIYDLKSHERHLFVKILFEELVEAPKALWHPVLVVLDEAHMFCPEKGQGESAALDAVIDLATRGRKRGLSLFAATQRIGKFHKSAAAELKNKLIGSTGLDVDVKRAAFELGLPPKEALVRLRALDAGHFFAFGPALNQVDPRELVTGEVLTTHPKVGHRQIAAPPKPTAAIMAVLPKLADLPKEAEQELRTIEDLKRELTSVRRELNQAKKTQPAALPAQKDTPDTDRRSAALIKRLQAALEDVMKFVVDINAKDFTSKLGERVDPTAITRVIEAAVQQAVKLIEHQLQDRVLTMKQLQRQGGQLVGRIQKLLASEDVKGAVTVRHNEPFTVAAKPAVPARTPRPQRAIAGNGSDTSLPRGEAAVLRACIQYPDGLRRDQLTVMTGYKRSSRDTYIQRLREQGLLNTHDDRVIATDSGIAAMPSVEPLPTGEELQRFWLERLPKGERDILKVLIDQHPEAVARTALDELTGYRRSSRDTYLQRLRARQLIDEPASGQVRASEVLF